jgi:hypothetical protein
MRETRAHRRRTVCLALLAPLAFGLGAETLAHADDPPKYWAVTGVAKDDVLNLRDVPSADSKSLGGIPPNAHGLKHLGCLKPEPSLDRWMSMTPDERANAKLAWCRVDYRGRQGWVAARFLKPDPAPAR